MRKQKQMVSLTLAATMVISGMPTGPAVSFAAEADKSTSAVEFTLDAENLRDSMEHAVAEGNAVQKEDLAFTDGDVKQIEGTLFDGGTLYELAPEMETSGRDGDTGLKVYLNVPDVQEVEKYGISGDENLIFLYENYGTDTVKYTVSVENAMGIGSGNFKVKTATLAAYGETFGWADEHDEYASAPNAAKKSDKDLAALNGDSTVKAYRTKVNEVLNLEKLTVDEAAVPATMSMRMILAANANELVNVKIAGADESHTTGMIGVGDIAKNAPPIDGYRYVNATVNDIAIHSVGVYNGAIYYTTKASGDTAMLLNDGDEITLNYEQIVEEFEITYTVGENITVENMPKKVRKGSNYSFTVKPSGHGKVLDVKVNGTPYAGAFANEATGEKLYNIKNVTEKQIVEISEKTKGTYSLSVPTGELNQGTATVNSKTVVPGGSISFTLKSNSPEWDGGKRYEYHFNSLTMNGKDINIPATYNKGDSARTSFSPDDEEIIVELTDIDTTLVGNHHTYTYTITINNVYHDIKVDNWNFKIENRNEIIVKQMDGVDTLYGWDNYSKSGIGSVKPGYKKIDLAGTTVLLQKNSGESSAFYF